VDKYLAIIPKPAISLPRVNVKEPDRTAERRITHHAANVPLPAIAFTYLTPPERSPDSEPLRVAATILSEGESSRLYRSLIYEQQVAQSADATPDLREDAGLFYFNVVLAGGKKPEEGERALLAEIKKMQDAPVSAAELDKAKNQLLTNELRQRETSNGKALALGSAAVLLGDPSRVNTDLGKLQSVTAADVQRVMKKYFTDANRLVIIYLPQTPTPATASSADVVAPPLSAAATKVKLDVPAPGPPAVQPIDVRANPSERPMASKGKPISGVVIVEVTIDEQGNVIKAKAISGPRPLRAAAEEGARGARFTPTIENGRPVKVVGVITYDFKGDNEVKKNAH